MIPVTHVNTYPDSDLLYAFRRDSTTGIRIYWVRVKRTTQKYRVLECQKNSFGISIGHQSFLPPSEVFLTFDDALKAGLDHISREISFTQERLDDLKHLREAALQHPPITLGISP